MNWTKIQHESASKISKRLLNNFEICQGVAIEAESRPIGFQKFGIFKIF